MAVPTHERPYVVVGAGPSGLSAARAFAREGLPFVVLERHTGVGGIWDIDNAGSPMYESAHFISSRTLSALSGFPMPDDYPDYPDHRRILAYLRDFAAAYDLERHVRFGTEVHRLERRDQGWDVHVGQPGGRVTEVLPAAGVVMASGNFWRPNLPSYPGTWAGEAYHSVDYRSSDQLRGRRVLVVGAGNSGCDIACDAAKAAERAAISMRRGYRIVPKHVFGRPTDVFARSGPQLPGPLRQRAFNRLLDLLVGDLTRFGVPAPDHDVLATHPIMNTRIVDHFAHGDLVARPDVAELMGDRVRFVDGTVEPFDTIIWATGYHVGWSYLDRDHFTWTAENPNLFLNVFPPDDDDLFALGVLEVDAGAFPIISLQADLVAQVVRDQADRPEQAAAFRRLKRTRPDLSGGIRHVDSPRHSYYVQDAAYRRYASELLAAMRAGELSATWAPPQPGLGRWLAGGSSRGRNGRGTAPAVRATAGPDRRSPVRR